VDIQDSPDAGNLIQGWKKEISLDSKDSEGQAVAAYSAAPSWQER
jgi:hypothetical protein